MPPRLPGFLRRILRQSTQTPVAPEAIAASAAGDDVDEIEVTTSAATLPYAAPIAPTPGTPAPPVTPPGGGGGTTALPLTAHRLATGTGATAVSFGVPIGKDPAGFTLTAAELGGVGVFLDGVQVPAFVKATVIARADGTLPTVLVQFDAGTMTKGTPRTGVELRKGVAPMPLAGGERAVNFARNMTAPHTAGFPAGVAYPSAAIMCDSGLFGPQVTVAQVAALGGDRKLYDDRFVVHGQAHYSAAYNMPRHGAPLSATFDRLSIGTADWGGVTDLATATDDYARWREVVMVFNFYDFASVCLQYWARSGDPVWLERGLSVAYTYTEAVLYTPVVLADAQHKIPGSHYQMPDSPFYHYCLTGDAKSRATIVYCAAKNEDGIAQYLNTWNPAEPLDPYGHQTGPSHDPRIVGRMFMWMTYAGQVGDTSRPWAATLSNWYENVAFATGANRAYISATADRAFYSAGWCMGIPNNGYATNSFMHPIQWNSMRRSAIALPALTSGARAKIVAEFRRISRYLFEVRGVVDNKGWTAIGNDFMTDASDGPGYGQADSAFTVRCGAPGYPHDLNLMHAPMMRAVGGLAGDATVESYGDALFDGGIREPVLVGDADNGQGTLEYRKQFCENYCYGFHYLAHTLGVY